MANSTHASDSALANVSFETFRNTRKDERSYLARIVLNGVKLPLVFDGDSTESAKNSAAAFFKSNVFDRVFDFSHAGDTDLTHKSVLSLFAHKPGISNKVSRKSAGTTDGRHAFAGLVWYVNKDDKPVRIRADQIEEHEGKGFLPGKKYAVALARYEGVTKNKKGSPGYVNPIAGKVLLHRGTETLRAEEDQVPDLIKQGWARGRVPKAGNVALPAPEKAGEPVSEADKGEVTAE